MSKQELAENLSELPPEVALLRMTTGYMVSQAIYVAARLGIADQLKCGPQTVEELARATGANEPALSRVLRTLASVGVFAEDEEGRFGLTPLAVPLQTGPRSMRAMTIHMAEEPMWQAWGDLLHTVRTGETAWPHVHGKEVFDYYGEHQESGQYFNEAMTDFSNAVVEAVVRAYDFSQFGKIVDVGGGHAVLIAAILKSSPRTRGVLFDLPPTVSGARERIGQEGLSHRCELAPGDFFESVPAGGDAYLMKLIIHDWDDERAIAILKNIRRAMKPGGKLLLVEMVVPPGNELSISKVIDLHMMVVTGGRERTAEEYARLFEAAGLRLSRVIPTESMMSLIEAVRTTEEG